jgi:hypothetical protein
VTAAAVKVSRWVSTPMTPSTSSASSASMAMRRFLLGEGGRVGVDLGGVTTRQHWTGHNPAGWTGC